MTLDDEAAERIADETWAKRGKRHTVSGEEYVRAGYAARDAEVEELRAQLAKVRERVERRHCADDPLCGHDDQVWADHFSEVVADVLAILDESPTERETTAGESSAKRLTHTYMGDCPDDVNGWESRDPECPACRALMGGGSR